MTFRLILVLLFAVVAWEQLANASKIAYKKPLYGKPAYTAKEKRLRMRPASIPSTTAEPDWPASVEFLINTTPTSTATSTMRAESSTATIIESSTLAQDQQLQQQLEQKQVAESNGTTSTVLSIITTPSSVDRTLQAPPMPRIDATQPVPCTCGVFLSSQIQNGLPETPLIHNEMDRMFQCDAIGRKQCQTKCLEAIVQHLPNSANIVCATLGRDCHKERAYLFIKNCHNQWVNTNLQAGREYCCKQGVSYRCPLLG